MDFSKLQNEFESSYKAAGINKNRSFLELCEMLEKVLNAPSAEADYPNLPQQIGENLLKAIDFDKNAMLALLTGLEILGKKTAHILGKFSEIERNSKNEIHLWGITKYFKINHTAHSKAVEDYRDTFTHEGIQISRKDYYILLENIVLTILNMMSSKYIDLTSKLYLDDDFSNYLKDVIAEYEHYQAIFTELDIKEYIHIDAKETLARNNNAPNPKRKIEKIRKELEKANEPHFMLLGDAGMGKSTTLRWLAKTDAEKLLKNTNIPLPVYLNLSSFTTTEDNLLKRISQRLEKDQEYAKKLLDENKINLFLDGFNEILPHLNDYLIRHLQAFIDQYPTINICIASRPVAYEKITFKRSGASSPETRKPVRAFILQQMEQLQMEQFIDKNYKGSDSDQLKAYINKEENEALKKHLQNPLYLAEFLLVYNGDKEPINSITLLTKHFIELKYIREFHKTNDSTQKQFHTLLSAYTQEISYDDNFGFYNPTVDEKQLFYTLKKLIKEYRFDLGVDRFVELALGMNLLVKDRQQNTYSFAHQSYQDFFSEEDI